MIFSSLNTFLTTKKVLKELNVENKMKMIKKQMSSKSLIIQVRDKMQTISMDILLNK